MPRTAAKPWERQIRQLIKGSQGDGWLLRSARGNRTQVIRAWEDGTRSTSVVPIEWSSSNGTRLAALIDRLARLMAEQGLQLAEAVDTVNASEEDDALAIIDGKTNWEAIAKRFRTRLVESGELAPETYKREGGLYVQRTINLFNEQGQPKNGSEVLGKLIKNHPLPSGSVGRKRMLSYAARFLNYAVDKGGAPERFKPPDNRIAFEGRKKERQREGTPILDSEFIRIWNSIISPKWKLAIGLAGVFGLRPFEIWHCQPEKGGLRVRGVKRNRHGTSADRLVHGLDPENCKGLSEWLLQELTKGGEESLPKITKSWGERLNHYLMRQVPPWKELINEALNQNNKRLTPYGFRHGYAWRGGQQYDLSPRVLSALMGHSVAIHLKHYGNWASEAETMAAVGRAIERTTSGWEAMRTMP
jgi:integrase